MRENGFSKIWIVVIALVVIIMLGAGAFTYLFFFHNQGVGNGNKAPQKEETKYTYPMQQFRVNVAGTDYQRFLIATVVLGYDDKKVGKELEERQAQVQDTVNNILSQLTLDDFNTDPQKEKLKKNIEDKVNGILNSGRIIDVYIPEFIVQ